jgi:exopolyphosphatase/guanosine-5'-triphosphate,3'-diphosphate pyrophosphatase
MIESTEALAVQERLAAIDVGTNTIRLVVVEVAPDGTFRVIDDERVRTRLGRSITETNALSDRAMADSAEAIAHFKNIADGYGVTRMRAVATSAVRDATNGEQFAAMIQSMIGIPLEIIPADDEARLAFLAVSKAFELGSNEVAVVDVGGGSTELVLSSGEVIERICPLRLGAVKLTEQFGAQSVITGESYTAMRRFITQHLRKKIGKPPFTPNLLIGTGGTFTNLAAMVMYRGVSGDASDNMPQSVRGYELQRSELKHFLNLLRKMPASDRQSVSGLKADRADIIVAGLTIVDCLLKYLGVNRVRIHDQGIRAGLIHQMIGTASSPRGVEGGTIDRVRTAQQFAATCQLDESHAQHVACLAMQMFDDLVSSVDDPKQAWSSNDSRELLHAASVLHDVGYLISYSRHHKHSYHIIMHSGMVGFTRRELEIIANVARYHRGARPTAEHVNFVRLSSQDQLLVRRLASILRIAVGLDRSHRQLVSRATLSVSGGAAQVEVRSADEPSVELWGAERKSRLFAEVFEMPVKFTWNQPVPAHEVSH